MGDRDWRGDADLDLGSGHWLRWSLWMPDLTLEGNGHWAHLFTDEALGANGHTSGRMYVIGASILHIKTDGGLCEGGLTFERPELGRPFDKGAYWTVESWEPLTLSPSILCRCGDHGYIRQGRWVAA